MRTINQSSDLVYATSRAKLYPDGSYQIMAASRPIFRRPGWEDSGWKSLPGRSRSELPGSDGPGDETATSLGADETTGQRDTTRARRRARTQLKDLAKCNDFKYFVTLTLDGSQIDRYDPVACTKKLQTWLDNNVRRRGLKYIIVPEYHKDKAIHYHGFINDVLEVSDSGTMIPPGGGSPRKPRSKRQRSEWLENGGHLVYNLPRWTLGYTTAIELYGDRNAAIAYVCKYISKTDEKIGGRWYYHGGDLVKPELIYGQLTACELSEVEGAYIAPIPEAKLTIAIKEYGA